MLPATCRPPSSPSTLWPQRQSWPGYTPRVCNCHQSHLRQLGPRLPLPRGPWGRGRDFSPPPNPGLVRWRLTVHTAGCVRRPLQQTTQHPVSRSQHRLLPCTLPYAPPEHSPRTCPGVTPREVVSPHPTPTPRAPRSCKASSPVLAPTRGPLPADRARVSWEGRGGTWRAGGEGPPRGPSASPG